MMKQDKKIINFILESLNDDIYNEYFTKGDDKKIFFEFISNDEIFFKFYDNFSREIFLEKTEENLINQIKENFGREIKFTYTIKNSHVNEVNNDKEQNLFSFVPKNKNFSNFIISDFNNDAFKSVKSICLNQKNVLNPMYIYGKSGLGKSHLIYSFINDNKSSNITFFDYLDFVNIFENKKEAQKIKERIIESDIFILDDINFMSDENESRRNLLYFLNNFVLKNKTVLLTSNVPPSFLTNLDDRIISRIEDGLIINLQEPNPEEMKKILLYKIENILGNVVVTEDVIRILAQNYYQNIRKINGIIKKISFYFIDSKFKEININFIKKYFPEISIKNNNFRKPSEIIAIEELSNFFNVPESDIFSNKKNKNTTNVKKIMAYVLLNIVKEDKKYIMELLNVKTLKTINNYFEQAKELLKDKEINNFINNLRIKLYK